MEDTDERNKWLCLNCKTFSNVYEAINYLAFIGGSVGALLAMYLLRHKTKKDYFTVGVPLIMIMQVVVLFYAMNAGW